MNGTTNMNKSWIFAAVFLISALTSCAQRKVWTPEEANAWYEKQPWLVGANYNPANTINQLEFWQAETFDAEIIDEELALAEELGFNTMRVYLHHLPWEQDAEGYFARIDTFLSICAKHKIKPMFVIFDSCWNPYYKAGKQPEPTPHVHNSGWVQDPGKEYLEDPKKFSELEVYVKALVGHFRKDDRILLWDIWNEPDNNNTPAYNEIDIEKKGDVVAKYLPVVFEWVRAANPLQPITSAIWLGDWSSHDKLADFQKIQIDNSDVISFHNYENSTEFEKRVLWLQRYNKPLICTEYMARGNGSTFQTIMPMAKHYNVALYNWGFVQGKSNTNYPWDSWKRTYTDEPVIWFHDIYRTDGTPYDKYEEQFIRNFLKEAN